MASFYTRGKESISTHPRTHPCTHGRTHACISCVFEFEWLRRRTAITWKGCPSVRPCVRACVRAGERADERAGERLGERAGGRPGERLGGQAEKGGRLGERAGCRPGGWAAGRANGQTDGAGDCTITQQSPGKSPQILCFSKCSWSGSWVIANISIKYLYIYILF